MKQINLSSFSEETRKKIKQELAQLTKASTQEFSMSQLHKAANDIFIEEKEKAFLNDLNEIITKLKVIGVQPTKLTYGGEVDRYDGWLPYLELHLDRKLSEEEISKLSNAFEGEVAHAIDGDEGDDYISIFVNGEDTVDWEEGYNEEEEEEEEESSLIKRIQAKVRSTPKFKVAPTKATRKKIKQELSSDGTATIKKTITELDEYIQKMFDDSIGTLTRSGLRQLARGVREKASNARSKIVKLLEESQSNK